MIAFTKLRSVLFVCIPILITALSSQARPAQQILRFGVLTLNHPLVMYRQYLPFTDFLAEKAGIEVELVLARNYKEVVSSLVEGRIEMALLAGVSYLEVREFIDIHPLCGVLSDEGTPTSRSEFFSRVDRHDINTLGDLSQKQFVFGSQHSTSGYLQPLGYLYENGMSPLDFASSENLATQDAVVRAVLRGTYDAGVVSTTTLDRFKEAGLKILATTPSYPGFVIVSTSAVPVDIRYSIRQLLLNLNYTDPGVASSTFFRHAITTA